MIKPSTLAVLAWGLLAYGAAIADGKPVICAQPALPGLNIVQVRCDVEGGTSMFSFFGPEAASPYANDFDRRRVVIAKAISMAKLKLARGLDLDAGSRSLPSTGSRLLSPPAEDQIVQREQIKNAVKKRGWHIATERVSYGEQGGGIGFVMDCSTATRWHKTCVLAVAECYPLEERQRFVQTLELIQ